MEITINAYSVQQFFSCATIDEVKEIMGEPSTEENLAWNTIYYYENEGISFSFNGGFRGLEGNEGLSYLAENNTSLFEINGVTLDKSRNDIVELLGEPDEIYDDMSYRMIYYIASYKVEIGMESLDSGTPYGVTVSTIQSDENLPTAEAWFGFDRLSYYTGLSLEDMQRYPDDNEGTKVFLQNFIVTSVPFERMYLLNAGLDLDTHILIDDSEGTGPALLVGDTVSVYGTFTGINTLLGLQYLWVEPDRIVLNSKLPDIEDISEGLVQILNTRADAYSNTNRYTPGGEMSLVVDDEWFMHDMDGALNDLYVDGYLVVLEGNFYQFNGDISWMESYRGLYTITGNVSSVEDVPIFTDMVYLNFDIYDIKPYPEDEYVEDPNANLAIGNGDLMIVTTPDGSPLRLREGPGTEYDVITEIPNGVQIEARDMVDLDGWRKVAYLDEVGYVSTEYLIMIWDE